MRFWRSDRFWTAPESIPWTFGWVECGRFRTAPEGPLSPLLGCPITLDVPGNKLERGDGTFAFNLSFQHRLSQPVLAKTLHSLYARRLAEGWGRNLQEAISTGFTDYTLRYYARGDPNAGTLDSGAGLLKRPLWLM